MSITYSETDFWRENRPIVDLIEIGSYGTNPDIRIWDVEHLKDKFLEDFRNQYPDRHRSLIGWLNDRFGKWLTYYQLSIFFLGFVIVYFIRNIHRMENKKTVAFRFFLLFILSILSIMFFRYEAEYYIEKRLRAELWFVQTFLETDANVVKHADEDILILQSQLYKDLQTLDESRLDIFWWSRVLERYLNVTREFQRISDEEFEETYGYLEYYENP